MAVPIFANTQSGERPCPRNNNYVKPFRVRFLQRFRTAVFHGIGGIALEHDELVCAECESNGTCHYCGEYVGSEQIDGETGYCTGAAHSEQWCHERHSDASDRSA